MLSALFVLSVTAADHTLLEFRKVSQINLIFRHENIQIPTADILSEMQILLNELNDYNCTSINCENGRNVITNALANKNSTLFSLFGEDDKALNRKKRSWDPIGKGLKYIGGVMDSDDRQVLERKVNILYENQKTIYDQLESVIEGLQTSKPPEALKAEKDGGLNEVEKNLKHVQELIGLQAMSERYEKIADVIDGIWRTFFNKKIDGIFVTSDALEKLKDLPNLACASIIDCVRNADADVSYENSQFIINLRIPLASDRQFKLFEITSIPADLDSNILLLKFPQKYFAFDENNKKLISVNENGFSLCQKSSDDSKSTVMYCRAKDIIANVNSDECLEKAFRDKEVDSALCSEKMELLQANEFGVIEIGKGKFWVHIKRNSRKDMVMFCDKNDHEVKTFTNSQVFSLVFGCHAVFRADGIDLTSYVDDESRRLKAINASISKAAFSDIIETMSVSNYLKSGFQINLQAYQPKGLNPIPMEIEVKHQTATSSELKTLRAQHSEVCTNRRFYRNYLINSSLLGSSNCYYNCNLIVTLRRDEKRKTLRQEVPALLFKERH